MYNMASYMLHKGILSCNICQVKQYTEIETKEKMGILNANVDS